MTPEQIRQSRALLARPDATVSSIARLPSVSRSTIYTYIPELTGGDLQPYSTVERALNAVAPQSQASIEP